MTDFSSEWLELIGHQGVSLKPSMSNSTFYTSFTGLTANSLPAYIGFRICAIRETFEESGVLLVKPLTQDKNGVRQSSQDEHNINANKLNAWRKVIQKDASLFLQFCKDIQCVPDIWSLYEWSNWITPANNLRRYNTIFYLAFLDDEPEICHDGEEVTNSLWMHPDKVMLLRKEYKIAPPQFVEMSRLCRWTNIQDLKTFVEKSLEGIQEWEPVVVTCKNKENTIYFFPGDTLYENLKQETYRHYQKFMATKKPEGLNKIPSMKLSQTIEELQHKNENMNRLIINMETQQLKVLCNYTTSQYNMPPPLNLFKDEYSKL